MNDQVDVSKVISKLQNKLSEVMLNVMVLEAKLEEMQESSNSPKEVSDE